MKKTSVLLLLLSCLLFSAYRLAVWSPSKNDASAPPRRSLVGTEESERASLLSEISQDRKSPKMEKLSEPLKEVPQSVAVSSAPAQTPSMTRDPSMPSSQASGGPTGATKRSSDPSGPSIGTVRVLGHRGCPSNTQGWFLSVGNPEQYDFSVSEDGETVAVEPNTPNLTGNFEFIHCADPGQFSGKRVRFSAQLKAQDVKQTAQLHLRGEDFRGVQNLSQIVKATGTYDWRDLSVDAEVGPEVSLFSYGVTFRSSGKLWISHPTFAVVP